MYKIQQDYKDILSECFSSDKDLLDKWHIESGTSLENCVNRTYNDLKQLNIEFYPLYEDSKLIGYFCKEEVYNLSFLTGFFIKPEYRKKEYIKEFWNIVNNKFNNKQFYAGIYEKNIPAINFLKRNNAKEINKVKEYKGIVFMLNGVDLCH